MPHKEYIYTIVLLSFLGLVVVALTGIRSSASPRELRSIQGKEAAGGMEESGAGSTRALASGTTCKPTAPDHLGPFYEPNGPVRSSVGKGYILTGVVKSSLDCSPIAGARIEFWLANIKGRYDDDHRATVFSDEAGEYRFESNFPPSYSGRPSHIHIRVSARGYRTLVTQHYPVKGLREGTFDLVIIPTR